MTGTCEELMIFGHSQKLNKKTKASIFVPTHSSERFNASEALKN
jgi:hypothetical protein